MTESVPGLHFPREVVAVDKNYANHAVIAKARELADALAQSDAFREKDTERIRDLIIECNQQIGEITKINYGSTCQPRGGCCG